MYSPILLLSAYIFVAMWLLKKTWNIPEELKDAEDAVYQLVVDDLKDTISQPDLIDMCRT